MSEPEIRCTSRLLVFDPQDRLLLFQYQATVASDPAGSGPRAFWYTPGGGIEPGETPEDAALRELDEEAGIRGVELGPCVATCRALRDKFIRIAICEERYYVVRAPSDRIDTSRLAETDIDPVLEVRWWNVEEFIASRAFIIPDFMPALAQQVLNGEIPATPIDFS